MTSLGIISFLAAHFMGDWILQSRKMAHTKSSDFSVLLGHIGIISLVLWFPVMTFTPDHLFILIPNAIFHGLIDWNMWRGYKEMRAGEIEAGAFRHWEDKLFYDFIAVDQFLHLAIIYILFT